MSWSVNLTGKGVKFRAKVKEQFEAAKKSVANQPTESICVQQIEELVEGALHFLDDQAIVRVEGNGSAYVDGKNKGIQFKIEFSQIYGHFDD